MCSSTPIEVMMPTLIGTLAHIASTRTPQPYQQDVRSLLNFGIRVGSCCLLFRSRTMPYRNQPFSSSFSTRLDLYYVAIVEDLKWSSPSLYHVWIQQHQR